MYVCAHVDATIYIYIFKVEQTPLLEYAWPRGEINIDTKDLFAISKYKCQ